MEISLMYMHKNHWALPRVLSGTWTPGSRQLALHQTRTWTWTEQQTHTVWGRRPSLEPTGPRRPDSTELV